MKKRDDNYIIENERLIDAIEKVNGDYLELVSSKEYVIGRRIVVFCNELKRLRFDRIVGHISAYMSKKRSPCRKSNNIVYNSYALSKDIRGKRIAVYSCITGGYECINDPYFFSENCDFFLFTDTPSSTKVWKSMSIPSRIQELKLNFSDLNRYIKMHPYELFPDYDYTIYIDGKITIISDLTKMIEKVNGYYGIGMHNHSYRDDIYEEAKACIAYKKGNKSKILEQIRCYTKEGMPFGFGMREAAMIIVDIQNENGQRLLDLWWKDYKMRESGRDQLSLPYVIWKDGRKVSDIDVIDDNIIEKNSRIRICGSHKFN